MQKGEHLWRHRHRDGGEMWPCDDQGRDQSDVAASPGTPGSAGTHQKPGVMERFFPGGFKGNTALPTPWFRISDSRTKKEYIPVVLNHPGCGNTLWQLRNLTCLVVAAIPEKLHCDLVRVIFPSLDLSVGMGVLERAHSSGHVTTLWWGTHFTWSCGGVGIGTDRTTESSTKIVLHFSTAENFNEPIRILVFLKVKKNAEWQQSG